VLENAECRPYHGPLLDHARAGAVPEASGQWPRWPSAAAALALAAVIERAPWASISAHLAAIFLRQNPAQHAVGTNGIAAACGGAPIRVRPTPDFPVFRPEVRAFSSKSREGSLYN